jgi:hypothetical protein
MTHLSEIWSCIRQCMPRRQWVSLQEIYSIVEERLTLDAEDFAPQSPTSDVLKCQRNVRNVLQYRKGKGDIEWNGDTMYRL